MVDIYTIQSRPMYVSGSNSRRHTSAFSVTCNVTKKQLPEQQISAKRHVDLNQFTVNSRIRTHSSPNLPRGVKALPQVRPQSQILHSSTSKRSSTPQPEEYSTGKNTLRPDTCYGNMQSLPVPERVIFQYNRQYNSAHSNLPTWVPASILPISFHLSLDIRGYYWHAQDPSVENLTRRGDRRPRPAQDCFGSVVFGRLGSCSVCCSSRYVSSICPRFTGHVAAAGKR